MDYVIHLRSRGEVTLPMELRAKYGIQRGDLLHLVDLDGVFVLAPMPPVSLEQARAIKKTRRNPNQSAEEIIQSLRSDHEEK